MLARLGHAAGGNLSAPTCGGNATSAGAAQMANLSSTLSDCSDTIDEVCNQDNLPTHNFTNDEACLADMDTFEDYVTECSALEGSAACDCWMNNTISDTIAAIK